MKSPPESAAVNCLSCGHAGVLGDKYCSECGFPLSAADPRAPEADTLLGKTLPGGYRVVEFIAEGSMGRVYRAEQANLGRSVAVKIMNAALLSHPKMVDRFRTEARAASMLNHPNCTRVYDFGETNDRRPYIVMELLSGRDLELLLRDEPLMPISRVIDIVVQVLRALEEAHDQGIVHRDLKPANVFILPQRGGGDLVKVVDFGLAKLRSAISGSTMTGIICGTPAYMAPEQATAVDTDGRTDLYALGVMLFEMIAGKAPFDSDDPNALLRMQVFDKPPRLAAIAPERSTPQLDAVVDKVLSKDPKDRYASATAFADALQEAMALRTGERRAWARTALRSCVECGGLFPANARFCGECGAPAPRESVMPPSLERALTTKMLSARPPKISDIAPAVSAKIPPAPSDGAPPPRAKRTSIPPPPDRSSPPPIPRTDSHRAIRISDEPPPQTQRSGREQRGEGTRKRSGMSAPAVHVEEQRKEDARSDPPRRAERTRDPRLEEEVTGPRRAIDLDSIEGRFDDEVTGPRRAIDVDRLGGASSEYNDLPAESSAALVVLERIASQRRRAGDLVGSADALRRAVATIREDIDRGELDDPIHAMALFQAKLGEALLATNRREDALDALREAVLLMEPSAERVRLLLLCGRAARELGRDSEAERLLEEAEVEAEATMSQREPPRPAPSDARRSDRSSTRSEPVDSARSVAADDSANPDSAGRSSGLNFHQRLDETASRKRGNR